MCDAGCGCLYTHNNNNSEESQKDKRQLCDGYFCVIHVVCKIKSTWCIFNDDFISDSMA